MARKVQITQDYLLNVAFMMAKQEGLENVTARKLAARAECSTQPIFRLYENMEDLWKDIFRRSVAFFSFYYEHCQRVADEPFVNLGYAYIQFAKEEKELFRVLFVSENKFDKTMYEILNGEKGIVVAEIEKAKRDGCKNTGELFTRMWIFIHGIACMTITGDYDLDEQETIKMLKNAYGSFK